MKSKLTLWLGMYLTLLLIWSLTEALRRFSGDAQTAIFWVNFGAIGWTLMPVLFYLFTMVYTGRDNEISKLSMWSTIFSPAIIFLILALTTDLITSHDITNYQMHPWGIEFSTSKYFIVFLVWLEALYILGMINLIKFYRKTKDFIHKKQVKIFIISTTIPLIGGTITDGIFPIVGIAIFPVAIPFISIMSLIMVYGIYKYGLFNVSPIAYSNTILETMSEVVLGLDSKLKIQYMNKSARLLLIPSEGFAFGNSVANFINYEKLQEITFKLKNTPKGSDSITIAETEIINSKKESVSVNLNIQAVKSVNNELYGYIFVYSDISKEKKLLSDLSKEKDTTGAIISSMAECLVVINTDMEITLFNEAALNTLEIKKDEFLGKRFMECLKSITKNDVPLTKEQYLLARTLREKKPISITLDDKYVVTTITGKSFPFSANTSPIFVNGEITGAMIIFRDITNEKNARITIERKVAEQTETIWQEEAKLDASIQSLTLGFIMLDLDGNIIRVNNYAGNLFGSDNLTSGIESIDKIIPLNLQDKFKSCISDSKNIEIKKVEFKDKILEININPIIMDNEPIGAVMLISDTTKEIMLQKSKDEFFSIASHELRTPLTAIRGNASMIESYYSDALKDDNLKSMINDIHSSSIRLISLVNDFLDASRLEQGKMTFDLTNFDVSTIINQVIAEIKESGNEKSVTIKLDTSSSTKSIVYGDSNKTKQVIYNLIGNALKFTENGQITLLVKEDKKVLKIKVIDTGKGISQDKQKLIFQKFRQGGKDLLTRDSPQGSGLGLYISKLLIERMGGQIGLESSIEGKGSTFFFTLPVGVDKATNHETNT